MNMFPLKHLPRRFNKLPVFLVLLFSINSTWAAPISEFSVRALTSSIYNPTLPNSLTTATVLNGLNWEVSYSTAQSKISTRVNGGWWMAFITATTGDRLNNLTPTATFNGFTANYFGTYHVTNAQGRITSYLDQYFGGFTPPGTFTASTISAGNNLIWSASWYAY